MPDAEERLLEDLEWAGLAWDEGPRANGPHGPYRQSDRTGIYQQHARDLLNRGAAYRCFCKPQEAGLGTVAYVTSGCYQDCSSLHHDEAREKAQDRGESFTVRLRRPADVKKRVYPDLVYGKIVPLKRTFTSVPSEDSESGIDAADTVLVKSDGTPTYHFANVVDDHLMEITHVVRGSEWMASTPLHYDLYEAFGWNPPKFAHVGLLVDENKAKLSKRNSDLALDVRSMREEHGVLPETLINFLALQGWSNPQRNDVMTLDQLQAVFDIKFTKGNTMVKFEKLWYLQKQHVARKCEEVRLRGEGGAISTVVQQIRNAAEDYFPGVHMRFGGEAKLSVYCEDILLADSKSYQTASQFVQRNRYFFEYDVEQTPSPPEAYGTAEVKIPALHVEDVVSKLVLGSAERAVIPALTTLGHHREAPRQGEKMWFDRANTEIHDALHEEAARAAQRQAVTEFGAAYEADPTARSPSTTNEAHPGEALPSSSDSGRKTPVAHERVATLTQAWNRAIMRCLREKLSYGLPGPSIGVVMAILGYDECCRRLGMVSRRG